MIVEIKTVPNITRKGYKKYSSICGLTTIKSKDHVLIEIAEDKNKELSEFSITLLHELLHVWISIIKSNGAPINLRLGHKFIYAVELEVAKLSKLLKGKIK